MSGWGDPDGPNKRRAEHTLQVANKRHHLGDVNPGREYVEPRVYQQPNYDPYDEQQQQVRASASQPGVAERTPPAVAAGSKLLACTR
jgi:hypothetical protein